MPPLIVTETKKPPKSLRYNNSVAFDNYKSRQSVVVVYTGEGKGKTSAGLGLLVRALAIAIMLLSSSSLKTGVCLSIFSARHSTAIQRPVVLYKGGKVFTKPAN